MCVVPYRDYQSDSKFGVNELTIKVVLNELACLPRRRIQPDILCLQVLV